MKKIFYKILVITSLIVVSCGDNDANIVIDNPPVNEGTEIIEFSFLKSNNPSLLFDINLTIDGNVITGSVSYEVNIKDLIATFEHDGLEVIVGNSKQISGTTHNDFSKKIIYSVRTSDQRREDYEIVVSYYTGLPIFYINTNGVPIDSKDEYREGYASIFGGLNFDNLQNTEMKIRGRGNSTWGVHDKKPYQLKFNEQTKVLGIPKDRKWLFLAEHSDKTLLRNKIAFEMGYLSNLDWTPKSEYAEVFLNNEYNGTYHISQKVEESNQRVVLGDTGYLLEIDQLYRLDDDDVYFYTNNFLICIKEPEVAENSSEYDYIKNLIIDFEANLYSSQFTNPTTGYASFIDVDSFVDWYLINEITKNVDARWFSSIFLNVIPGEKIKMGPLWDFDLAFGNVDYADSQYWDGFWIKQNPWYGRLFEDPAFVEKVKQRFSYFRDNQNFILDKIDFYANYLSLAQEENDIKWDIIGNYAWPNPVVYDTYEEEVAHLKNWYVQRMNWLANAFNNL